jgi:hypothetical protein
MPATGAEPTSVRLDSAAPDLAMVHLDNHKIAFVDLTKEETPIGEGTLLLCLICLWACACVAA